MTCQKLLTSQTFRKLLYAELPHQSFLIALYCGQYLFLITVHSSSDTPPQSRLVLDVLTTRPIHIRDLT